jgi:hypothetical protein
MQVSNSGEWQLRRCDEPGCLATTWRVRRDPRDHETWWVGRLDGSATWRIAASEPCCPVCAADLVAGERREEQAG